MRQTEHTPTDTQSYKQCTQLIPRLQDEIVVEGTFQEDGSDDCDVEESVDGEDKDETVGGYYVLTGGLGVGDVNGPGENHHQD